MSIPMHGKVYVVDKANPPRFELDLEAYRGGLGALCASRVDISDLELKGRAQSHYESHCKNLRQVHSVSPADVKPRLRDSLLEGYVLWFRNSNNAEGLALRLIYDLPKDHREIVMDAYKAVKRERRAGETAFELVEKPLTPAEIAEDALFIKREVLAAHREIVGNSARKALAVPGPFERSRRDILMNR